MCNIGSNFSNFFSISSNILRVLVPALNYGLRDVVAFTILLTRVFNNDANASVIIVLSNIMTVCWQSVE